MKEHFEGGGDNEDKEEEEEMIEEEDDAAEDGEEEEDEEEGGEKSDLKKRKWKTSDRWNIQKVTQKPFQMIHRKEMKWNLNFDTINSYLSAFFVAKCDLGVV